MKLGIDPGAELGPQTGPRAQYYFSGCGSLRAGKGLTKKTLAQESGIDRSTLDKVEGGKVGVTEERVMRVFNCLNETYYGGALKLADCVTTAPANGAHRQRQGEKNDGL